MKESGEAGQYPKLTNKAMLNLNDEMQTSEPEYSVTLCPGSN